MQAYLEYIPLIVFFIAWKLGGVYWATGSLMAASALTMLFFVLKKEKIPTRMWVITGIVMFFGALTIFFQNEAFIIWKVTVVNLLFAFGLLISKALFKKNLIKEFLKEALTLPDNIWNRLNLAWAVFFITCGALNIYVAYNFELDTWVNFKVFGLTGLTFAFTFVTIYYVYKYLPSDEESEKKTEQSN